MSTDDRVPLPATNTGRVLMVPRGTTWVSEIIVTTSATTATEK